MSRANWKSTSGFTPRLTDSSRTELPAGDVTGQKALNDYYTCAMEKVQVLSLAQQDAVNVCTSAGVSPELHCEANTKGGDTRTRKWIGEPVLPPMTCIENVEPAVIDTLWSGFVSWQLLEDNMRQVKFVSDPLIKTEKTTGFAILPSAKT